jgi:hypothetical protein
MAETNTQLTTIQKQVTMSQEVPLEINKTITNTIKAQAGEMMTLSAIM